MVSENWMDQKYRNVSDIRDRQTREIVKIILNGLGCVNCYIYHISKYGSVYLKFWDEESKTINKKLCSIRVANHRGREKYKYKYNVELTHNMTTKGHDDYAKTRVVDDQYTRYYYSLEDIDKLFNEIKSKNLLYNNQKQV